MDITELKGSYMEMHFKEIPLSEIDIPAGRRESENVDDLMDSISMVDLIHPPTVTPQPRGYLVVVGVRRCIAYERLGYRMIPAIIREMDELHAELMTIDENLIRRELTALEHAEEVARRKEIYEALHPETKQGHGPGRGRREKKRKEFASFADDTASKTGCTPRTVQQEVQIARGLSDRTKELIRPLPIADKKSDLLRLARLPEETQEAIVGQLVSGGAKSVREAQRALDAVPLKSKPTVRRSSREQTAGPQSTGVELRCEERDTILNTVVALVKQSSAIATWQIAGRPAADVMAERLTVLPKPEIVLLAGLMTGSMQEAAEAWVAAVRADVQDEDHHCRGVMPQEGNGISTNDTDGLLISVNDQAEASAGSVSAAHASIGDDDSQGEQLRAAAVVAVQSDDGAAAEMQVDDDQLHLPLDGRGSPSRDQVLRAQGEEKQSTQESLTAPSRPARSRTRRSNAKVLAASTMGELTGPVPGTSATLTEISGGSTVADPMGSGSPDVQPAGHVAAPATQNDHCGWCGLRTLWSDPGSGRIYCETCHAVYNPSTGLWAPGQQDHRQSPPASMPGTAA